jgi:hypothetical protein
MSLLVVQKANVPGINSTQCFEYGFFRFAGQCNVIIAFPCSGITRRDSSIFTSFRMVENGFSWVMHSWLSICEAKRLLLPHKIPPELMK